jgi:hypothetical protein
MFGFENLEIGELETKKKNSHVLLYGLDFVAAISA